MMAVIAGIPDALERRLRAKVRSGTTLVRAGWNLAWVPTFTKHAGISDAQEAQVLAAAQIEADTSILVVARKPQEITNRVVERVRPHFRVRVIRAHILTTISTDAESAIESLNRELEIEESWHRELKPSATSDPLLLPETSFLPHRDWSDLWRNVVEAESLERITRVLVSKQKMATAHRCTDGPIGYECLNALRWSYGGEKHGVAPFPRTWKFSFKLPQGMHFDVTSRRNGRFAVHDAAGQQHAVPVGGYVNIDPHGFVRR